MSDKSIFQKIKEHGFKGTMQVVGLHISEFINKEAYYFYQKKKPIDSNLIVMESEGDLSDNAYALYDYMRSNGYLQKYHIVWLVDNVEAAEKRRNIENFPNTKFVQKVPTNINTKRAKVLATCKWYIYDHCNELASYKKRTSQIVVYLSHGFAGYKAGKISKDYKLPKSTEDYINTTGNIPEEVGKIYRQNRPELKNVKVVQIGFPRLDYFFVNNDKVNRIVQKWLNISSYKKVFLWMPTFRESNSKNISENYQTSETKLPLLVTLNDVHDFNDFLQSLNCLMVLKVHHLQKDEPIFKRTYSNIIFLSDEQIISKGIQLYQFIPLTDALITDYSSISADYMLLDKPMVFILDDYDEYNKSRGIIPKNAKELWAGDKVYSIGELKQSLIDIVNGEDHFKIERNKLLPKFYKNIDGNASKRILAFYKINK